MSLLSILAVYFLLVVLFSILIPCFQVAEVGLKSAGRQEVGKTGQTSTYIGSSFSVVTGRVGRLYYE